MQKYQNLANGLKEIVQNANFGVKMAYIFFAKKAWKSIFANIFNVLF